MGRPAMWKREKEFRQELAKAAQKSSKGAISKLETIAVEDALQVGVSC